MAQPIDYRQMVFDTITQALTSDPNPEVRAKAAESLAWIIHDPRREMLKLTMHQGIQRFQVFSSVLLYTKTVIHYLKEFCHFSNSW